VHAGSAGEASQATREGSRVPPCFHRLVGRGSLEMADLQPSNLKIRAKEVAFPPFFSKKAKILFQENFLNKIPQAARITPNAMVFGHKRTIGLNGQIPGPSHREFHREIKVTRLME
jgi:hypothetical protein